MNSEVLLALRHASQLLVRAPVRRAHQVRRPRAGAWRHGPRETASPADDRPGTGREPAAAREASENPVVMSTEQYGAFEKQMYRIATQV